MVRCSILSRTWEEDLAKETEVESNEADMVSQSESTTPTIGKRPRTHQGSLTEGGAILPYQVAKIAGSNAGTVENLGKLRRGVPNEEMRVSFNQPATHELCHEFRL